MQKMQITHALASLAQGEIHPYLPITPPGKPA